MSEVTPLEQLAAEPVGDDKQQKQVSLDDIKVGYIVGLTKSGDFVFDVLGQEKGLVEVLGIHKYADLRVEQLVDTSQMVGDRLVAEVGRAVAALHQKVDDITKVILPAKKPANQL